MRSRRLFASVGMLAVRVYAGSMACNDDPTTGLTICEVEGPATGTYRFPDGAEDYTLLEFGSGRGGDSLFSDRDGGFGAEIRGTAYLRIPDSREISYVVGANGTPGERIGFWDEAFGRLPRRVAPENGGDSWTISGSGGSPSQLPDAGIYLGAGGGASWADGGNAGTSSVPGERGAGQNGDGTEGGGGRGGSDADGSGGKALIRTPIPFTTAAESGQAPRGGRGYKSAANKLSGGGGGGTGGGGASKCGGGGGSSMFKPFGLRIVPRKDKAPPKLRFQFNTPRRVKTPA